MRTRYFNALLWRGGDTHPALCDFDVVNGRVSLSEGTAERTIDLAGAFTMPAFRDGHSHPLFAGREAAGLDVSAAKSVKEIQQLLIELVANHPGHGWIDAAAYDPVISEFFTRQMIDEVVADRPVVIHSKDHHSIWVNTAALKISGIIPAEESDPAASGILSEWASMRLVLDNVPALTLEEEVASLVAAQRQLRNLGVAEVQDAWIDKGMAEIYVEALSREELVLATRLAMRADPSSWDADFGYFDEVEREIRALKSDRLEVNSIKFFIDGVLSSGTAQVLEPYAEGRSQHSHGKSVWEDGELLIATTEANRRGYQLHFHAIGDHGVRTALDLIEAVTPSRPAVIAHAELISDQDIARFKALNVTANFEPLWARNDEMLAGSLANLGHTRADKLYRMRDLVDSGARISFGSDWPVSNPDPCMGIATAVNRCVRGETPLGIEQALTVREALTAYTAGSAIQIFGGDATGTLFDGDSAQFITLNLNPFAVPSEDLFDLRVSGSYF